MLVVNSSMYCVDPRCWLPLFLVSHTVEESGGLSHNGSAVSPCFLRPSPPRAVHVSQYESGALFPGPGNECPFGLASERTLKFWAGVNTMPRPSRMNGSSRDDGWQTRRANGCCRSDLAEKSSEIGPRGPWLNQNPVSLLVVSAHCSRPCAGSQTVALCGCMLTARAAASWSQRKTVNRLVFSF